MPRIRILPPEIVHRIAAGEVIERPASVLKELVENAIDADATEISVLLEEGGKKRILVRDDGHGMSREDLVLAFEGHATSKLDERELESNNLGISSLGFRGEALPSIASVGRLEAISRREGDEHAWKYRPGEGDPEPSAGERGTSVDVRDLFHSVPARRKFLRTGSTELSHCVRHVSRLAIGFSTVRFRIRHGNRELLDLPPTDDLGERLRQIVSPDIARQLIRVSEGDDPTQPSVLAYVGRPSLHRRDTREQHFFVGGRWVRDRTLSHALKSAYQGFHIPGYQPVGYVFLDFPRDDVDANVHPTKTEVRFRDPSTVYRLVHHAVRSALEGTQGGEDSADGDGVPAASEGQPAPPRYEMKDLFAELASPGAKTGGRPAPGTVSPREPEEVVVRTTVEVESGDAARPVVETVGAESVRAASAAATQAGVLADAVEDGRVLQVLDSYIVAEVAGGVLFIDQHALHEIILFERVYDQIAQGVVESQRLLVPEVVRLPREHVELVDRAAQLLGRCGFELESFGPDSVALHALPAIFDREAGQTDVAAMVHAVFEDLERGVVATGASVVARERGLPEELDAQLRRVGATIACKRAVKAGMPLSPAEVRSLLERAGDALDPRHCPHGRPTAVFHARRDIERLFDRK